jgi:hypothetical protein
VTPSSIDGAGRPRGGLILGWFLLLALAHGLLWLSLLPPWQAPDEPKHFEYIRLLAERPGIVAFRDSGAPLDPELQRWIIASMDRHRFWWYGHAPGYDAAHPPTSFQDLWVQGMHTATYRSSPAYYLLAAALQPADRLWGLYLARALGVLLGALGVFFIGWAARELFPDAPFVRYGAPALAALQPMAAFLAAGVNNDALANALAAFAFLLLARLLARGASPARLLLLLLAVAAAVATKRTTAYLLPTLLLLLAILPAARARRPALGLGLGALLATALGAFGWRWLGSGGWDGLPSATRQLLSRYFFNEPDQLARIVRNLRAPGIGRILLDYLAGMHHGFWGSFGWQVLPLPGPLEAFLGLVTTLAAAGLLRRVLTRGDSPVQRAALLSSAAAVALVTVAALAFFAAYLDRPYAPPPQGRYLFAAWGPVCLLLSAGLAAWLPERRQWDGLKVLLASLLLLDGTVLLGLVLPFYYR